MAWARMRFRADSVWVLVEENGRPILDRDGRAEMKYRLEDSRSYRPGPTNLIPIPGGETAPGPKPPATPTASNVVDAVHVWTDGACSGNPGPMGIGVVVIGNGQRRERGDFLGNGTNNIAELVAIERGLALAAEVAPGLGRPVRVYSDSGYAIGLLSKGWKAKANQDLVARLRQVTARVPDLTFVKVPGHSGVPENERCDELARLAIERQGPV